MVSESLEKFTQKLREGLMRVPENPAEMFGFAAQIIRNVVLDHVKKREGPKFRTQFPSADVPLAQSDRNGKALSDDVLERLSIQEAVSRLSKEDRSLIDLKYVWGMTDDEIAKVEKCNPRTVRRRLSGILLTLRRTLEPPE